MSVSDNKKVVACATKRLESQRPASTAALQEGPNTFTVSQHLNRPRCLPFVFPFTVWWFGNSQSSNKKDSENTGK
jgi:hypothetical protein